MLEILPSSLGHLLQEQRAGLDKLLFNAIDLGNGKGQLEVSSLAFEDHAPMPVRYTADGEGVSPPLAWSNVPGNATSVVVVVEDADSPTPNPLVHAIVVNLDGFDASLQEAALPSPGHEGLDVDTGRNSYLRARWLPPDPPPGHGTHRYAFQVFALVDSIDDAPGFVGTPGRDDVVEALKERAIASGCLIGTYERADPVEPVSRDNEASSGLAAGGATIAS